MTDPVSTPESSRTPGPVGGSNLRHRAGGGQEAAAGVLAVDAELDRVAARCRILGDVQRLAVGDAELFAHQVDARGLLGDRVLHLKPRVDLQERDQPVLADQVLDRACAVVVGLFADSLGRLVDLLALRVGQERRGCLLDQFLEAALQRAVAGTRDDDIAVLVGDHLRLDVARLVQVPLDEALAAAERRHGLAGRGVEQFGDLLDGAGHLHAAAAAAERRLDRHRDAVLLGERDDLVGVLDRIRGARNQRRLGARGDVPRGDLVAEVADGLRARTDPDQVRVDDRLREIGVLRKESVAGVDRVRTGFRRRIEQLAEVQIGLRGRLAAEGERLIGEPHVRRIGVGFGVHGHARDPGVPGRTDHPDRDLPAIGDQHLGDT